MFLRDIGKIHENAYNNEIIRKSDNLKKRINIIMEQYGLAKIDVTEEESEGSFEGPF